MGRPPRRTSNPHPERPLTPPKSSPPEVIEGTPSPEAPRRRRRLRFVFVGLLLLLGLIGGFIAAIPWWLGTDSGRRWLLSKADDALAPARLEVARFDFSWFGPTRMDGFALVDAQGDRVVSCPSARLDRGLFGLLFDRPRYGELRLERAVLEVERLPDGQIDLYETLRPILKGTPETSFTIAIADGTLRLRGFGPLGTIEGRDFRLDLARPAAPNPLTWQLAIASPPGVDAPPGSLALEGRLDRWHPEPHGSTPVAASLTAESWPLAVEAVGVEARARLGGRYEFIKTGGLLHAEGSGEINGLALEGPKIGATGINLGPTSLAFNMSLQEETWTLDRLDLHSEAADLGASGTWPPQPERPPTLEARIDLQKLEELFPATPPEFAGYRLEGGVVRAHLEALGSDAGNRWNLVATGPDLALSSANGRLTIDGPAVLSIGLKDPLATGPTTFDGALRVAPMTWTPAKLDASPTGLGGATSRASGTYERGNSGGSLVLDDFGLATEWIALDARGRADFESERPTVDLSGEFHPDWSRLSTFLTERVEPAARIEGGPGRFVVSGAIDPADPFGSIAAELSVILNELDVYGLRVGATPIAGRIAGGQIEIEPIDAPLNGGRLLLAPRLDRDDQGSWTLLLDEGSGITDAEINDEVSHRLLSYVAPVLDRATSVRGRVGADISKATFPLGEGFDRAAEVEGRVIFRDVEFVPGPLADSLAGLVGGQAKTLRLDQPVALSIRDGVVHQSGFSLPIGGITAIEVEGDVGFDRSLALTAQVPLTSAMVAERPFLSDVLAGTKVRVPIGGTLSDPKLDREAFRAGMRDLGRSLLENTAMRGAAGLLMRLTQPRPPRPEGEVEAGPPPSPRPTAAERREERRRRREQKRADREAGRSPGT